MSYALMRIGCNAGSEMGKIIYLVGMMGAGKSTVGRILAEKTGWPWVDMDRQIEQERGLSIPRIFELLGEAGFRRMETDLLRRLSVRDRLVVSTGGGVILSEENRRILSETGLVVYLRVSAETVLARTRGCTGRPKLAGDNKEERVRSLLEARHPLYCATSDISFRSAEGSPAALAARILAHPRVGRLLSEDMHG